MCETIKRNFKIRSVYDDIDISGVAIYREGDIRAVVQFSHGMCEHKERYFPVMEYLAAKGYACIINDHRGHGESVRAEEDFGYFYTGKDEAVVEDLHDITRLIKANAPDGMKLILFGHSMGSLIVRAYLSKYDTDIDGLVVCGSPSNNPAAGLGIGVVRLLQKFKGDKHRSELVNKLVFGANSKGFEKAKNSWLCSDEAVVSEYNEDKRDGFTFTLNGFETLFKLVKRVYDRASYNVRNAELPIMFIAGAEDPVIISKDKWLDSQKFLRNLGYKNIASELYEGMRHEILNEKRNIEVYKDVLAFADKCTDQI